ncbi:MAG: lipid-A-disaccharide synthase N-terminal domain-containing protein [Candidatus Rokubacteria bacterium]|nr:lipid-A-disaccharide synthase N-terminal domain-containing protein [Candidatus Rokubacteria bacterium]
MTRELVWIGIGLCAEGCFGLRILLQWIASERRRRSVFPVAFWYLSLSGNLLALAYATYRLDPVFIAGEVFGVVVSARNLQLIRRRGGAAAR